jgi:hypothetical protein
MTTPPFASTKSGASRSATGCSTRRIARPVRPATLELARLRPPRLPGMRRGARGSLRARCGDASDERQLIAVNATGCLEVFSTPYPETSWRIAWLHSLFGNAPAVATGVAAAMKVKGKSDVRVVGQAGDGGTVDIGFGCLSGCSSATTTCSSSATTTRPT